MSWGRVHIRRARMNPRLDWIPAAEDEYSSGESWEGTEDMLIARTPTAEYIVGRSLRDGDYFLLVIPHFLTDAHLILTPAGWRQMDGGGWRRDYAARTRFKTPAAAQRAAKGVPTTSAALDRAFRLSVGWPV